MIYLNKIISSILFLSSISLINKNETTYYKLIHFRLIEDNEGIIVDILFNTKKYEDKIITGSIYISDHGEEKLVQTYKLNLDGEPKNFTSLAIPYSYFEEENCYLRNISYVDYIYQKESMKLHYYPNKKDNEHLTLREEDNDKYLSTKFIHESYDLDDNKYNFTHFDRIKFSNFFEYEFKEGYSFFDPRNFKFIYENGKDNNIICDPHLYIFDTYNIFKRFPYYNDTMYKILPISIIKINDKYNLCFKDGLYYDPITFEVSPYYINGYKYDEVLYLPIDKFEELKSINFKLKLNIKGYMDFDISSEFEIGFNKKIYGDCDSSLYCTYTNNDTIEGESEINNITL